MPPEPAGRDPAPLLAFDTSGAWCAAALVADGAVRVAVEPMARGQAERLVPMLEEMLTAAGLGWRDLGALAVGTGPGNFTGVRIAVALARGLALGLGVPAVGVTGFEALAEAAGRAGGRAGPADLPLRALIPAPQGMFHAQTLPGGAAALLDAAAARAPGARIALMGEIATGDFVQAIARVAAARGPGGPRPAPFYLRPADAAPPAEPAPVILPDPA